MYLKRLELQGFKSFPEKIKLDFNKGITAVVGPNGSGKSNISDAIRWVLGEQSAKSLRGGKMEDIIFAGTQSRRALGFAEVAMTIDNSDHRLNLQFSEITVVRRVYRSGEGQYFINDTQCRLKDVHELFMDTGIGKEGYSIIGQGRIDEILSAKSEDRRLLFEEAAGIVKYKNRKREAEIKLEREKQNLLRVNDIISELESQITPLAQQAEKAKLYLSLAEKSKLIDINIFIQEVSGLELELQAIDKNINGVHEHIQSETNAQAQDKLYIERLKEELTGIEERLNINQYELGEARSLLEKKEGEIRLNLQKTEHIESDISRLNRDIVLKREAISKANENKKIHESKLNALSIEYASKNDELNRKQTEFDAVNEKLAISEALLDRFSSEHIEKLRLTSEVEGKIQRAEAFYEQLEKRKEDLNRETEYNESRINDNDIKLKSLEKLLAEQTDKQAKLEKESERLESERARLNEENEDYANQLRTVSRELNDASSRQKLLSELETSYEGYYKSVKAVLKQKQSHPQEYLGICGAVAELVSVPEAYETAIEIAFGGALQNIITDTEKDAQKTIEYLKRANQGRATFLPISSIHAKNFGGEKKTLLSEIGAIGVAKELIQYESKYENIMANLLGKVLVFDNLDNAAAFSKKHRYQYKVVTMEGDIINPGGSLTGGSINKGQSNILSRSREIHALNEKTVQLIAQKEKLEAVLNDHTYKISTIIERIEKNKFIIREAELQNASLNANSIQVRSILEELYEKRNDYEIEERQLMNQIVQTNKDIRAHQERCKNIEAEIEDILNNMDSKQSALQADRERRECLANELTAIKVSLSSIQGNLASARENIVRIDKEIGAGQNSIQSYIEEIAEIETKRELIEETIEALRADTETVKQGQSELYDQIETLNQMKEVQQTKINQAENDAVKIIEKISALRNELTKLEMKKEHSSANSRRLYDDMWEQYGITYQEALKYEQLDLNKPGLHKASREIKNEIKTLGVVNVNAVEEYKAVQERFEFLSRQRDDIYEAEEKLKEIICQLKELMEKQFTEQFALISKNFSIVFSEMFSGGTAYLKLSDETDVLESGIEIISQPPGKNLQNMLLFSGGERALTAIALLFGILRMKPSPFCILDEIEAALDDANVKRFANYLKNFADDTQFIIITHRKGTMEAADILYGVTMQEQGVSKLVSVKFSEDNAYL